MERIEPSVLLPTSNRRFRAGEERFEHALLLFHPYSPKSSLDAAACLDFLRTDENAFERSNPARHFTGSAIIVDRHRTSVLLTLHAKMGKWLQLGGHCDGLRDPFFVAWKEAYEESGLGYVRPLSDRIVDLGVHGIAEHNGVPAHEHYDIRYLFEADAYEPLGISDESKDLRWVLLGDLERYSDDPEVIGLRDRIRAAEA